MYGFGNGEIKKDLKGAQETMNTLKHLIIVMLVVLFSMGSAAIAAKDKKDSNIVPEMNAKATQIIRMNALTGINPREVSIERGTTVIWINESEAMVELQFEGKQVTIACKSPVHFIVDDKGSFISDRIPTGSVASLCFVEKGEYNYVMRKVFLSPSKLDGRPNVKEFKGTIVVK